MISNPTSSSTANHDGVRICLITCGKLSADKQEECLRLCLRGYWSSLFKDMNQLAVENDISLDVLMRALKTEFESQFDLATTDEQQCRAIGANAS